MSSDRGGTVTIKEPREAANLAELYDEEPMPWSRARDALGSGSLGPEVPCFLGTVRPDGRPHAAGVGVAECDGELYFTSGPAARKARNLAANPACTLSLRLEGIDLVLEGDAVRVTDPETLAKVTAAYRDGGWPAEPDGDAVTAPFSAQSAGPPPWHLYRLRLRTAFGVGLRAPHGASRWRF
jgi:Pyridoxamine 5'-phosphate oxidase